MEGRRPRSPARKRAMMQGHRNQPACCQFQKAMGSIRKQNGIGYQWFIFALAKSLCPPK